MPRYANWQSGRAKDSVIVYGFDSHSRYCDVHVAQLADELSFQMAEVGGSNPLIGTVSGCGAIGSARDLGS